MLFVLGCGGGETGIAPVSVPVNEPVVKEPVIEEEEKYPKPSASELDAFLWQLLYPPGRIHGDWSQEPVDGFMTYVILGGADKTPSDSDITFREMVEDAFAEMETALPFEIRESENGALTILYSARGDWSHCVPEGTSIGCYNGTYDRVEIDSDYFSGYPETALREVVLHELVHSVGLHHAFKENGDPEEFREFDSIMNYYSDRTTLSPLDWWGMKYIWENFEIGEAFPGTFDTAEWLEQQD